MRLVRSLGAGAAAWLSLMAVGEARAERTCEPLGDGRQRCEVGVRSGAMDETVASVGGQRMSQWCWAASIAMVFRHYGYEVAQPRIVAETFGEVVNLPGTSEQMLALLSRDWVDDRGRRFRVDASAVTASAETALEDLAAGHPLVIGTMGHAMVLTAMGYVASPGWGDPLTSPSASRPRRMETATSDLLPLARERGTRGSGDLASRPLPDGSGRAHERGRGGFLLTDAVVRDPWPGNGRRALSPDEWNGADLLVRVRVTDLGRGPAPAATKAAPVSADEGEARATTTSDEDWAPTLDARWFDPGANGWRSSDDGQPERDGDDDWQADGEDSGWQVDGGEADWQAILWMLQALAR